MARRSVVSVVAIALIAMGSAAAAWSSTPTYTPGQVEAAFLRSGVPLTVASRARFPAGKKLSVLFVPRLGSSAAKTGGRTGEGLKVAIYNGRSSAEAAYKWVRQYTGAAELVGNVLLTSPAAGRADVQWALYELTHP